MCTVQIDVVELTAKLQQSLQPIIDSLNVRIQRIVNEAFHRDTDPDTNNAASL